MLKLSRRTFLGSAIASLLPSLAFGDEQKKSLTIRMRDTGPPRAFVDDDGKWNGFVMEAATELGRRAGFEVEALTDLSWKRALEMTKVGELDLLHSASWRQERTHYLDYIGPFDVNLMAIVVQKGVESSDYQSLDAFVGEGKLFARGHGVALSAEFDKRIVEDAYFASHFKAMMSEVRQPGDSNYAGIFQRISEGSVTGFIIEEKSLRSIIANPAEWGIDEEVLSNIDVIYPSIFDQDSTYITASKTLDPAFRDSLHVAYDGMRRDGEFTAIWNKWYPRVPEPQAN